MTSVAKKVIKSSEISAKEAPPARESCRGRTAALVHELGGVVNKRVLDAKEQAEAILARADDEAAKIRAEADALLAQVEVTHTQAKVQGHAEGRDEGLATVTEALATLERAKEEFFAHAESEIIKLVVQCAEKVFGRAIEAHQALVVDVVRQAIESSIGDRIVVSVSPCDHAVIMKAEGELRGLLDRTKRIHFKEDEAISPGGCVLETEIGTIDARLETQLKALRKAFDL